MRYLGMIVLVLSLTSCSVFKKKSTAVEGQTVEISNQMTVKDLQKQLAVPTNWNTLRIRANAEYKDEKLDQSIGLEIRIKKNEAILVSAKIGPITMAKALITPKQVQYYERLNSTYFDGDFAMLSRWLGTDLSYQKVEALLLGQVDWQAANKGELTATDKQWEVKWKENPTTEGSYLWNALNAVLVQQKYVQKDRVMDVHFSKHGKFEQWVFPQYVAVKATHPEGNNEIKLAYNQFVVNPDISFPYEVPSGFERVTIDTKK